MWRICATSEPSPGNYMQAACFEGDIAFIAKNAGVELVCSHEETGPIKVLHLIGPGGRAAIFVSHDYGDPRLIEVRLKLHREGNEGFFHREELAGALGAIGKNVNECHWISPWVGHTHET